ncbi:hypothetical protein GCM10029992_18630 [Glycomyces albus]
MGPEVHRWRGRWYLFTTLHDEAARLDLPPAGEYGTPVRLPNYRRSTVVAVADSLTGPFRLLDPKAPVLPPELMTLDGTLFSDDDGRPGWSTPTSGSSGWTAPSRPSRSPRT